MAIGPGMRRLASTLLLLTACAGHFKTERVGTGIAFVAARGTEPARSPGVQVAAGDYDLKLRFDLPRAQLVEWRVTCPGASSEGSVGEPFEDYRKRRLAQLAADRQHERDTAAAVTGAVVGAFAPSVGVHAQGASASVDARVSGQAAGQAAGAAVASSMDMTVELPPGDVGAGRVGTLVHVRTTEAGACSVTAVADDANVIGGFEIVRIRDLDAEARARAVAINAASLETRAQLQAQLVAYGADVTLRQRQRDAEAQARAAAEARAGAELRLHAEAELRGHAELEARAEAHQREVVAIEVHTREVALEARLRLRAQLIMWGADPELRARVELRARQEREAREARLRIEIQIREAHEREARARIDAQLAAAELERVRLEQRRLELAMTARTELRAYLVSIGARERPPMPALVAENPGTAPFSGAEWIAGHWTWTGTAWSWNAGGWRDASVSFGAAGGGEVVVGSPAVIETPVVVPVIIDALSSTMSSSSSTTTSVSGGIRDHRTVTVTPPRTQSTPTVRDHREPAKPTTDPKVRDHRH